MEQTEVIFSVDSSPLDESDEKLYQFFQNIQRDSLKTLEDAARQMINLSTTLLGLFFGVLAFKDNPDFLAVTGIKLLGAISSGLLLAGLFFALDVVMPRPIKIPEADLTEMRQKLDGLYLRKSSSLKWSQLAFGFGTVFLLAIILWLLLGR